MIEYFLLGVLAPIFLKIGALVKYHLNSKPISVKLKPVAVVEAMFVCVPYRFKKAFLEI